MGCVWVVVVVVDKFLCLDLKYQDNVVSTVWKGSKYISRREKVD